MTSYTDYFSGDNTVPPSDYGYVKHDGLNGGPYELVWPQSYAGTELVLADITELEVASDVIVDPGGLTIEALLPPATGASVGKDFIIVNLSSDTFVIKNNAGSIIVTLAAGRAQYFYLSDNSTVGGVWKTFLYGSGINNLDAGVLAGPGLKAISTFLVTNNLYRMISTDYTVVTADRARLVNAISGTITVSMPQSSVVADGFWVMIRNSGAGLVTVDGFGTELIDGSLTKSISPNESAIFVCNSAAWFTVGYGRSSEFVFSEYVIDAAIGDITLSSADVSGRMLRVAGTAIGNFTVTLPSIDNIYFVIVENGMGAFNVTFETAIGTGVTLDANQSAALYSDGTNVASAVTVAAISSVDLGDGLATAPSLRFQLDVDTGLFRPGTNELGIAAGGVHVSTFSGSGLTLPGVGRRIKGDLDNATVANRLFFQTTTANAPSVLGILANGSGTASGFTAYSGSDVVNASILALTMDSAGTALITSTKSGTGAFKPITFGTSDLERARIDVNGLFGIGGTPTSKVHVFAAANDGFRLTSTDGVSFNAFLLNTNNVQLSLGTLTNHPIGFLVNNNQVAALDTTGNLTLRTTTGGLGYGSGAGGTVTQITSKSTAVTLNRLNGQITTSNAALGAGATVAFLVNNLTVTNSDNILLTRVAGANEDAYNIWAVSNAGTFAIYIKNISGGSLSDALVINFAVIRGSTS